MAAFIASFDYSQSQDGSILQLADTSNISSEGESSFTARMWYLNLVGGLTMLANGSLSNTNPATAINFPFTSGNTLDVPLSVDWGMNIVLKYVSNNPQTGSIYTVQTFAPLVNFEESFLQSLTQGTQAQMNLQNDTDYKNNWRKVYTNIARARNAAKYQVVSSIQSAIDANYVFINNQSFYF